MEAGVLTYVVQFTMPFVYSSSKHENFPAQNVFYELSNSNYPHTRPHYTIVYKQAENKREFVEQNHTKKLIFTKRGKKHESLYKSVYKKKLTGGKKNTSAQSKNKKKNECTHRTYVLSPAKVREHFSVRE